MIEHEMLREKGVLIARPKGPLSVQDFRNLARDADLYIKAHGQLNGLIICAEVKHFKASELDEAIKWMDQ